MSQGNGAGGGPGGLWGAGMAGLGAGPVASRFQPYILQPGSPNAYTCFGSWEDKAPSCMPIEDVTSDDPLDGCSQAGECRAWLIEQNPPTTRFPIKPRRDGRFEIQQFRDFIRDQETYNMVTETGRIIVTYPGNRPVPKAKRFFLNVKNLEEAELDVDLEFELLVTVERMILRQATKGGAPLTPARPIVKPEEDEARRKDRIGDLLKGKIRKDIRSEDSATGAANGDDIDDFDFEGLELDEFEDDLDEEDIEVDLAEEDVPEVVDEAVEAELVPVDLGDDLGFDDDGELELELEGEDGEGEDGEDEAPAPVAEASEEGAKARPARKGPAAPGGTRSSGASPARAKGAPAELDEQEEPRAKGRKAEAAPAKAARKAEPAPSPAPAAAKGKKAEAPPPVPAAKGKGAEPEPARSKQSAEAAAAPAKGRKSEPEPAPAPAKGRKAEPAPAPAPSKGRPAPEPVKAGKKASSGSAAAAPVVQAAPARPAKGAKAEPVGSSAKGGKNAPPAPARKR